MCVCSQKYSTFTVAAELQEAEHASKPVDDQAEVEERVSKIWTPGEELKGQNRAGCENCSRSS